MSPKPSLWTSPSTLVLASKSASRRLLLESAGINVDVEAPEIDERGLEQKFLDGGGSPSGLAGRLARAKALDVSARRPEAPCLGADQTLLLEDRLFHKAADVEAAVGSLMKLAGRTHILTSALCVARNGVVAFEATQRATMTMRPLEESIIRRYLAAAGPAVLSSVGVYQIEGLGIHLFERIEGDHATILGLPLLVLLPWLRTQGLLSI